MSLTAGNPLSAGGGAASASLPPLSKVLIGTIEAAGATEVVFDTSAYDYDSYYIYATGVYNTSSSSPLEMQVNGLTSGYSNLYVYPNYVNNNSGNSRFNLSASQSLNINASLSSTVKIDILHSSGSPIGVHASMTGGYNRSGWFLGNMESTQASVDKIRLYSNAMNGTFHLYGYYNTETTA
jgi:hypothetical protein